jgi:hypothetical protein
MGPDLINYHYHYPYDFYPLRIQLESIGPIRKQMYLYKVIYTYESHDNINVYYSQDTKVISDLLKNYPEISEDNQPFAIEYVGTVNVPDQKGETKEAT